MARRVENHRKARGPEWQTVEEPIEVVDKITQYGDKVEVILLDCLTLWLSNLLLKWDDESKIMNEVDRLTKAMKQIQTTLIIVTNEVGMGIVPADPWAVDSGTFQGWSIRGWPRWQTRWSSWSQESPSS